MSYPYIQAKNYTSGRTKPIAQITLHYIVCPEKDGMARFCANLFAGIGLTAKKASSTYTVDNKEIYQLLSENDTPWTNAHKVSNSRSITIETAGTTQTRVQWQDDYSTAMRKNLVKLCAEIATRHNIPVRHLTDEQIRNGDKGFCGHGDITRAYSIKGGHTDMGINEGFPWDIFLAEVAQAMGTPTTPTPTLPPTPTTPPQPEASGFLVTITASELNVRSGPGTNYGKTTSVSKGEVFTITETSGDWGKLKSGAGWIHLGYTTRGSVHVAVVKKSNEAIAREVIAGKWGNGPDRAARLSKEGYDPKVIQALVNKML